MFGMGSRMAHLSSLYNDLEKKNALKLSLRESRVEFPLKSSHDVRSVLAI